MKEKFSSLAWDMSSLMGAMEKKSLWLIDGMALAYRAHFALIKKPIRTAAGINTSAVYGLVTTILDLIDARQPTQLAVTWDTSDPTPRHEVFPQYKAQRQEMPEELSLALDYLHKVLPAMGLPQIIAPGWEADDIMGTLSVRAKSQGYQTWLVSSDKDLGQLVNEDVFLYRPGRQGSEAEIWGIAEVCERWGISTPMQVTDILGLMGDASDNIPGVPGIGEKTAAKLLTKFPSVEELIKHADQISGKPGKLISEHAQQALLSKQLATICCDIPLEIDIANIASTEPDKEKLAQLFTELEFNTLGRRLLGADFRTGRGYSAKNNADSSMDDDGNAHSQKNFYSLTGATAILKGIKKFAGAKRLAVVLRAEGDDPKQHKIKSLSLASDDEAAIFAWPQDDGEKEKITQALNDLLKNAEPEVVGHDLKNTLSYLRWSGVSCRARLRDTFILQALINQDASRKFGHMCERYLGIVAEQKKPTQTDMFQETDAACGEEDLMSLAQEAALCLQLHDALAKQLPDERMTEVYHNLEMPLVSVLVEMEHQGIAVDPNVLGEISRDLTARIAALEIDIRHTAGDDDELNINSPKQLGILLFEKLALLEKPPRTKTGQYSTDEATLESLVHAHPVVEKILTHREYTKLKSTYLDALPLTMHPATRRIHTTFSQVRTATGRLSSEQPNLQNIPIRTELGRSVRRAFIPSQTDWLFLSADYSQIELRVMAALSADPAMIQAFNDGLDIHTATAARIHQVDISEVTSDMRRGAKTVNFGIIYGISAFGLSQRLGIARAEAAKLIEDYFIAYPGVKAFMDEAVEKSREKGYAETLLGRRRPIPEINSSHATTRAAAERTAINTPIQGTAADMIKLAMIRLDELLRKKKNPARLILQVHDELLLEAPPQVVDEAAQIVKDAMINALELPNNVPLHVETATGANWFMAHA